MNKKALNKFIRKNITGSMGRFISIFALMMLGAFALIGLTVTGPDMRSVGYDYFSDQNLLDVSIMGDYGIDDSDQKQIDKIPGVDTIEYGYFKDVNIVGTTEAIRVYSKPEEISKYKIVEGEDLKNRSDILLTSNMEGLYHIGDKVNFNEKKGADGEYALKSHSYTVVGFVASPEYSSDINMGPSTAGDGNLAGIGYVKEDSFDTDYFMVARIVFNDTKGLDPYTDEYREKIYDHITEIKYLMDDQSDIRMTSIVDEINEEIQKGEDEIQDARDTLDEKQRELDDAKVALDQGRRDLDSADRQLSDGSRQLEDGQRTLDSKWSELEDAKAELEDGKQDLKSAEDQLKDADDMIVEGTEKLEDAKVEIVVKEHELEEAKEKLAAGYTEYYEKEALLNEKTAEFQSKEAEFQSKKAQFETAEMAYNKVASTVDAFHATIKELEEELEDEDLEPERRTIIVSKIEETKAKIEAVHSEIHSTLRGLGYASIEEARSEINNAQSQLDSAREELSNGRTELAKAKGELELNSQKIQSAEQQLAAGKSEISSKESELSTARSKYDAGQKEYERSLEKYNEGMSKYDEGLASWHDGEQELEDKRAEYDSSLKSYQDGQATLRSKESQYREGLDKYEEGKIEAEEKIAEGQADIDDAYKMIDEMDNPVYTADSRREAPGATGYTVYHTVSLIIDKLSMVFPIFMYFVAALVTLTTMTRYVDEQRQTSGTLKGLGYSDRDIIKNFTIYGFIAGGLGTVVGIYLGHQLMPMIVYDAYGASFTIPELIPQFFPVPTVIAIVLAFLSSVLPAYIVAKKQLQEKPSRLLLPKPPMAGSEILLEKITPIWDRLSFTHKVTARNIFRYKRRMFMTIFGVAGSVTLLFAGLSVQRSIQGVDETQFGEIIKYDLIVATHKNIDDEDRESLDDILDSRDVKVHSPIYTESYTKTPGPDEDKQDIRLIVTDDDLSLEYYISLRDRKSGDRIELDDQGAVISERLAELLDVKVGDIIDVDDSTGEPVMIKISDITEMYTGHFIFMNSEFYERATREDYSANAELVILTDNDLENTRDVAKSLIDIDGVQGVISNTILKNQIETIVDSLDKIMMVLILVATLLAVVILYNLTNINVAERMRELSTIKVLGFYNNEVTMYIYRETILLSAIGVVVGYGLGHLLYYYILDVVPPADVMFDPRVLPGSYIIPAVIVSIITGILGLVIYNKLKNVDMLEALQSVD